MPRLIWHMDRLDSLVVAMFGLVVTGGVSGPSLRSVARAAGISPAGVVNHFGSAEQLWGKLAHRWMNDRKARFYHVTTLTDLDRHLAEAPDAVDDAAFDFALAEIGRGHEGVALAIADLRSAEREYLARVLPDGDQTDLDLLVAVTEGLRFAMSLPEAALPIPRAQAAMQRFVTRLIT